MVELADETGLRLRVADAYHRTPELEVGSVRLAAQVDPWEMADATRPTWLVSVDPLPAAGASAAALGARAVADEIAQGHRVVACDPWVGLMEERGRRDASRVVVSIWAVEGVSMEALRYVAPLHGFAVTMLLRSEAGQHHLLPGQLAAAVAGFADRSWDDELDDIARAHGHPAAPPVPPVPPVPPSASTSAAAGAAPTGSAAPEPGSASGREPRLPVQPPTRPAGLPIGSDDLETLRRGRPRRRADTGSLLAAGLIDGGRKLTTEGQEVHGHLSHPVRRFTVTVRADDADAPRELLAFLDLDRGVVLAEAPAGSPADGRTLTSIATKGLADVVVGWLGIGPVRAPEIVEGGGTVAVPAARLRARIEDPSVAPPEDVSPTLREMWSDAWRTVRLSTSQRGVLWPSLVLTGATGSLRIVEDGSRALAVRSEAPLSVLELLLRFSGYALGDRWERAGKAY